MANPFCVTVEGYDARIELERGQDPWSSAPQKNDITLQVHPVPKEL